MIADTTPTYTSAIPRGTYRHYKDRLYHVFGTVTHSETEEVLVLYSPLYDQDEPRLWVRPLAMFTEAVDTPQGSMPRFAYVGEDVEDAL